MANSNNALIVGGTHFGNAFLNRWLLVRSDSVPLYDTSSPACTPTESRSAELQNRNKQQILNTRVFPLARQCSRQAKGNSGHCFGHKRNKITSVDTCMSRAEVEVKAT